MILSQKGKSKAKGKQTMSIGEGAEPRPFLRTDLTAFFLGKS